MGRTPGDPRARLTRTVFAAVALGSTSLYAAWTVAPLVVRELGGSRAVSGIPGGTAILGTALGSLALSRMMARRGRRPGLVTGWAIGIAGAIVCVVAAETRSIPLVFAGITLVGVGHASNQLSRFSAADIHPVERRPRVLGWVVWASTIGAGLGPVLLPVVEPIAESLGFTPSAGGFLAAIVFYAGAMGLALLLRPDPSTFAAAEEGASTSEVRAGLRTYAHLPAVRLAVVALVAAQMSMIFVMTITPVHLKDAGHGLGLVGGVMSAHFVGMFAFAPLIGGVVQRLGHGRTMLIGVAVLLGANLWGAGSADLHGGVLAGPLFMVGVGWSFTFVSGSALLTRDLPYADRARVQGGVDALVWTASASTSLLSGIVLGAIGFAWVCAIASVIALVPARAAFGARTLQARA